MNTLKKTTVNIPAGLWERGLVPADLDGLVNRWLAIELFQQGKVSLAEAGELLGTTPEGFLNLLDGLGVVPIPASDDGDDPADLAVELAQTRRQLSQLKKQLARAEQARSEFIATTSHELRTPLNSILGFAKLLLNQQIGPLNEIQQTDLSLIFDSANHLLNLVNNILDLSKIEAGKIRLDMDRVTVEEIIVGVIASTYILIEGKPIELGEHIESGLPRLYADRERIRQVVINLLSNAAKFTDAGSITLRIFPLVRNDQDFVCFAVKDTGIGIAPENMGQVFEPFRQIDSSASRRAEGTGLGIPISARLVELHGGELWAESKPEQGSTFYFTLPVNPPDSLEANVIHVDYGLSE